MIDALSADSKPFGAIGLIRVWMILSRYAPKSPCQDNLVEGLLRVVC